MTPVLETRQREDWLSRLLNDQFGPVGRALQEAQFTPAALRHCRMGYFAEYLLVRNRAISSIVILRT
jgi:hypothetical protein